MSPLWVCVCLAVTDVFLFVHGADLVGKGLLFPEEGDQSYAVVYPSVPLALTQFTLCLRVATEKSREHDMIIFSYFNNGDELNLWREASGELSLYIRSSGEGVKFNLPALGALESHLCVTWQSSSGLTTFWFDGKRSLSKVYRKALSILPGGKVILGQDQDKLESGFEVKQSFVGEIYDLHLWNYILPPKSIKELHAGECGCTGNVISWKEISYTLHGNVIIRD